MTGIVDVGGGLRDIYGAGIMDVLIEQGISVDYAIGVSAGSANITSYAAGQKGRNYRYYINYSKRHQYMSFREYFIRGSYINLDYVYGTLYNSDGEDPLDYPAIVKNKMDLTIVAADAKTGETVYFPKEALVQDDYGAIKASSNVPLINKAYKWKGRYYYDGGIADPIPYKYALDKGCDKLVVILTRPYDYYMKPGIDCKLAWRIAKKYPRSAELLKNRCELYNCQLDECKQLEKSGTILITSPEKTGKMKMLTKDEKSLQLMYDEGISDAEKVIRFLIQ